MTTQITALQPADRAGWELLARGYKAFYETPTSDAEFDRAWHRLLNNDGVHGLAARREGRLIGMAHYLFHPTVWASSSCYLQDLFTAPQARGQGVARALIEALAAQARAQGCTRFYWTTREQNAVARALYDKLAAYGGFIRYDYGL